MGDDQFVGGIATINGATIVGGAGNDGVKLTGAGSVRASLQQVERLEVSAQGGSASIDLSGSSTQQAGRKMTVASVGSVSDVAFNGLGERVDLEVRAQSTGRVSLSYTSSALSADPQSVRVEDFGSATTAAGSLSLNGVSSAAITASGTNNLTSLVRGRTIGRRPAANSWS